MLGCVSPVGDQGADIAKTAAIKAGLPDTVAGVQLNRFCASGLEAVNIAAQKVASGWEDLVFAGGVESMSRVPMGSDGGAWAMDPETNYDTSFVPQGIGADLIATIEGFTREDVDAYAARSQERAARRAGRGPLRRTRVVPVKDLNDHVVLDHDEFIRPGTTVETLGELKPSFAAIGEMGGFDAVALQKYHWVEKIDHVHTPGNSLRHRRRRRRCVAIGNEQTGERARPDAARADPRDRASPAPTRRSCSPAPRPPPSKALAKAGLTVDDIDLVEINEAFAAVVLRFVKDMGLDMEKVNVNGGAIAMGHPLGATGGDDPRHARRRAAPHRRQLRPRHALRRRRHGHRDRRGGDLMTESTTIRWEQDDDGIVVLTLDDPNQSANTMNAAYARVDGGDRRPPRGREGRRSRASSSPPPRRPSSPAATSTTCSRSRPRTGRGARRRRARGQGAAAPPGDARQAGRRRASTAPRSAAAWRSRSPATTASSSTTRRSSLGFPEVQLGLLPGAGGVVRTVRMLGIVDALMQLLLQGQRLQPGARR